MVKAVTSLGRSGLSDWLIQRVSGIVLLMFVVVVIGFILTNPGLDYATWRTFFDYTYMRVLSTAAVLSLGGHAWIGLWAVSTDYFTERMMGSAGNLVRALVQAGGAVLIFTYVVWGLMILWS